MLRKFLVMLKIVHHRTLSNSSIGALALGTSPCALARSWRDRYSSFTTNTLLMPQLPFLEEEGFVEVRVVVVVVEEAWEEAGETNAEGEFVQKRCGERGSGW
jgi:hypothetical protein